MVFKDNFENKSDFKIRWLEMNPTGLSRAGTKPRTIVKSKRAKMENPAFVEHGGLLWMFLSRQDYTTCDYYTDAWSAPSLFETFARRKRLSGARPHPRRRARRSVRPRRGVRVPGRGEDAHHAARLPRRGLRGLSAPGLVRRSVLGRPRPALDRLSAGTPDWPDGAIGGMLAGWVGALSG